MSIFDKLKSLLGATAPPANDGTSGEKAPAENAASAGTAEKRMTSPAEDARLEGEARALFDAGDAIGAISLLASRGILFARHEGTSLPCLCKGCLRPEVNATESGGVAYVRDFVVTKHRVLFYWMPAELAGDARQVRASMRAELRSRLRILRSKEDQPKHGINPFTKQPIVIPPKHDRRRRINPFTGKRVP
jgi:hypothetical protein